MINDVSYRAERTDGSRTVVSGVQVGRFAVRMRCNGGGLLGREMRQFLVDHINSGTNAGDFDTFEDAMRFADDVSRFSAKDLSGRTPDRLRAQAGRDVLEWSGACRSAGRHIPFREWRAERAAA